MITAFVESFLLKLNIPPSSYLYLFPKDVDVTKLNEMVAVGVFPTISKLAPTISHCLFFSIARFILNFFLLEPLAKYSMNLKFIEQATNKEIERAFPKLPKDSLEVTDFCQHSKIDQKVVFKYLWNRKRNNVMKSKISKFCEASWRLIFYTYFCYIGYKALFTPSTSSWILDTRNHWVGWPYHQMTDLIGYYYQVELGCYLHQLLWTEVSRSDSLQMILHHLTTIALMGTSYLTNFTRVGASILLLHDTADIFLEAAKVFHYVALGAKAATIQSICKIGCDGFFVVFAITFFVTRLIFYPKYILFSVFVEARDEFGTDWMGYKVFCVLLSILQALHIFWFYLIAKMIVGLIVAKGVEKDVRSDEDEDDIGDFSEDKAKSTLIAKKKQ